MQLYYYPVADSTYDIRFVYVEIETCLAIIAACGPSLKPLLGRWFPQIFSTPGYLSEKPSKHSRYGSRTPTNGGATVDRTRQRGVVGTQSFALKDLRHGTDKESRAESPTGSEEEIMTYHGIMRTRDYTVRYANEADEAAQSGRVSEDWSPVKSS